MKAFYLLLQCLSGIVISLPAYSLPQDSLAMVNVADPNKDLGLADRLFEEGKLIHARQIYRKYEGRLDVSRKFRLGSTLILRDCDLDDFKRAYVLLNEAGQSGNKQAVIFSGWVLYNGIGVERDTIKGLEIIKAGVAEEEPWAYYFYGACLKAQKDFTDALTYFKKAAKLDHGVAATAVGLMYQYGYLGQPDWDKAQEWYKKGMRLNNASAYAYWARLLMAGGWNVERNPTLAYQNFVKAAEMVDPEHIGDLGLGNCYRFGHGVKKNLEAAMFHFRRAGEHRQSRGYCNLGLMYEKGMDVEKNIDSAMINYGRAANLHDTWACYRIATIFSEGVLVVKNDSLAFRAMQAGAELKDMDCEVELAIYYKQGRGVEKNLDKCREILTGPRLKEEPSAIYQLALIEDSLQNRELAISLLKKSAEKKYSEAMLMLARIYKRNLKDSTNQKLYTEWLEAALKTGNTDAMFLLGFENYYAINRARDVATGNALITQAARRGNQTARDLISLYPKDFGDGRTTYIQDIAEEAEYKDYETDYEPPSSGISVSAMDGNPDAQFLMGMKYFKGTGVSKNMSLAIQWFQQAAAQGHANSYFQLGYMYETGQGFPQSYADAMTWYELAAAKNVPMALNNIGALYYSGKGVPVDKEKAAGYYQKAVDQGVTLAKNNLGYYYLYDCDTLKGNIPKGIKLIKEAAEAGDELAQHNLAKMYLNGNFVKTDKEKGEYWLVKAAEQKKIAALRDLSVLYTQRNPADADARKILTLLAHMGHAPSIADLYVFYKLKNILTPEEEERVLASLLKDPGSLDAENKIALMRFYRFGIGTPKDCDRGIALGLEFAGPGSDPNIDIALADLYAMKDKPDHSAALKWYKSAADKGSITAAFNVGAGYYKGKGVQVNDSIAIHYTRMAAEGGYADAMRLLGLMCLEGRGIGQDFEQGVSWLEKAAGKNDIGAMETLASLYLKGEKVPKDADKAIFWLEKCANLDDLWAIKKLVNAYENGEGVKVDQRKQVFWLEKAVMKGDAMAMNSLGTCYYKGTGVKKDYAKAVYYYQQAIDHDEVWGKLSLGTLYLHGHGVPKDEAKARELYQSACDKEIKEACEELAKLDKKN